MMLEDVNDIHINRTVPWFLMSCYLYYQKNTQVLSDEQFDMLCKRMLDNWKDIEHHHKHFIKKADLKAGTGFAINWRKVPTIVKSAAIRWKDVEESE